MKIDKQVTLPKKFYYKAIKHFLLEASNLVKQEYTEIVRSAREKPVETVLILYMI